MPRLVGAEVSLGEMAADVIKSEGKPGPGDPITRDFLGGSLGIDSKELDLDLHVPTGWQKRLHLQSGKVYIERRISPSSSPDPKTTNPTNQTAPKSMRVQTVNLHQETTPNLDLRLFSNSPFNALTIHGNATYQSVCTLDKVRSALERVRKASSPATTSSSNKKRSSPSNSNSSMISITNSNNNNNDDDSNTNSSSRDDEENDDNRQMVAGACPGCLLYVLISKTNPKCPKCNSFVSLPTPKKPRIDLNMGL